MTWRWLDLVLEGDELAEELLLLRAPPAAEEVDERGIATDEGGQGPAVAGVVGQLQVGEAAAGAEVGAHPASLVGGIPMRRRVFSYV